MATIAKNLSRLNTAQLIAKADFIVDRMDGNPVFPEPTPKLSDITTAVDDLRLAVVGALDGGQTAVAIRRKRERDVRLLLNQVAGYVASVAEGNELAIRSAGFDVRRPGTPAPEPGAPQDVRAYISDHSGRVDLSWTPSRTAVSYHVQVNSTDPQNASAWTLVGVSTRGSLKVTGLPSGQVAYFRVAGIGTAGMGPWSPVAQTLVR